VTKHRTQEVLTLLDHHAECQPLTKKSRFLTLTNTSREWDMQLLPKEVKINQLPCQHLAQNPKKSMLSASVSEIALTKKSHTLRQTKRVAPQ
jgi:hypothetical protein